VANELTKYKQTDLGFLAGKRQELEERIANRDQAGFLKLGEGDTVLRFLPAKNGRPLQEVWVHRFPNLDPSSKKPGPKIACLAKNFTQPCPICKRVQELRETKSPADDEAAKQLSAKQRIYAVVVNMNKPDDGVRLYEFGETVYRPLLAYLDPKSGGVDIFDPTKGYNVIINRVGTGQQNTKYTVRIPPGAQPCPIANMSWLEHAPNLVDFMKMPPAEKIAALLEGRDTSADFNPSELGE